MKNKQLLKYLLFLGAICMLQIIIVLWWDGYNGNQPPDSSCPVKSSINESFLSAKPLNPYKSFNSFQAANAFLENTPIRDIGTVFINYPAFSLNYPKFENKDDRDLFLKSPLVQDNLDGTPQNQLVGEIHVIRNGSFKMFYECGWQSDISEWKIVRTPTKCYDYLAPIIVPMAFLFQHFVDGTLPKIFQSYEIVKRPEVKLLMEKPFIGSENILGMLKELNISRKRIVWHKRSDMDTVYNAQYLINTCITPPLHPDLWHSFRRRFGVNDVATEPWSKRKVILLQRLGGTSQGRRLTNLQEVHHVLEDKYGENLVTFHGDYKLHEVKKLFGQAKIIIGPHGGAFYNIQFSPKDTVIIEFAPVKPDGEDPPALPHAIFWRIADMIGQSYWRVPIVTEGEDNDMYVKIGKLYSILEKVESSHTS